MKEKMSYLDVLEETINFYSVDPLNRRSVDRTTGKCLYAYEGKNCAFGRYINDVDKFIEENSFYNDSTSNSIIETFGMDVMKKEVEHLNDKRFWDDLQFLHDTNSYWNEKGLTKEGTEYANKIKEYISKIN